MVRRLAFSVLQRNRVWLRMEMYSRISSLQKLLNLILVTALYHLYISVLYPPPKTHLPEAFILAIVLMSWQGFFPTPAPRTNMKSLSALLGQATGNGYKSAAFEGPILITVSSGNLGGDSQENFWKQDLVLHLKTLRVGSLKQLYQEVEDQGFQVSHARPTPFFRAWSFWCSWGKTNQINISPLSSMQEKQNY